MSIRDQEIGELTCKEFSVACWLNLIECIFVLLFGKSNIHKWTAHAIDLEKRFFIFGDQDPRSDPHPVVASQGTIGQLQNNAEDILIQKGVFASKLHALMITIQVKEEKIATPSSKEAINS